MQMLADGTLVGLPVVRVATMPKNAAVEDSILSREVMTTQDQELLTRCLENYICD